MRRLDSERGPGIAELALARGLWKSPQSKVARLYKGGVLAFGPVPPPNTFFDVCMYVYIYVYTYIHIHINSDIINSDIPAT